MHRCSRAPLWPVYRRVEGFIRLALDLMFVFLWHAFASAPLVRALLCLCLHELTLCTNVPVGFCIVWARVDVNWEFW